MIRLRTLTLFLMAAPLTAVAGNDFPTLDRVDYVLTCMKKHGGQTVDNLYHCSCEIDAIAGKFKFDEYTDARTFETYRNMPGEKGGEFRDSESGEKMVKRLTETRKDAEKQCFISGSVKAVSGAVKAAAEAGAAEPQGTGEAPGASTQPQADEQKPN